MKAIPIAELDCALEELATSFYLAAWDGIEGLSKWCNRAVLEAAVREKVVSTLERARDLVDARRQLSRFGDEQNQLQDFSPRLVEQGGQYVALAEIRFKALNKLDPFVELSFLSAPDETLCAVVAAALNAFSVLSPLRARAWFGRGKIPKRLPELSVATDQRLLVGQLRALERPRGGSLESAPLQLEPIGALDIAYRRYARLHARYLKQCPQIGRELHCSTFGEFEKLASRGMAFEAFVEKRWAGLVAAVPEQLWGQPGIEIHEEFLSAEFRGRGLGRALQRALIERLEAPPEALLWGTIHDSNQPSLRTALGIGREPLGAYLWLEPVRDAT